MQFEETNNPYSSPSSTADSESADLAFGSGLSRPLVIFWLLALSAIPVTGIWEETVINNGDPEFRLGWLHLIGPAIACLLPAFAATKIRYRFAYIIISACAVILTIVFSVIVSIALFGMSGVQ